ncbi:MAG: hypothetical protein ACXWT1_18095, partial [Methylobacter sp.]
NLNLIERFWKFFKKKILYGKYYETFCAFKNACDEFFAQTDRYRDALLEYKSNKEKTRRVSSTRSGINSLPKYTALDSKSR